MNIFNKIKYKLEYNNISVLKIIFSIFVFSVMIIIGIVIYEFVDEDVTNQNEIYNKAIKIDSKELFLYGMETNVGNAFIYGQLETVDPVTNSDIKGEYMSIKKVTEKYTKHTRKVSNGKTTRTETYYEWEEIGTEYFNSKHIKFMGVEFPSNKIDTPEHYYKRTVNKSNELRCIYYVVDTNYIGTLFTNLNNNTISDNSSFITNKTIEQTLDSLYINSVVVLIFFWIGWLGISVGIVIIILMTDISWLNN